MNEPTIETQAVVVREPDKLNQDALQHGAVIPDPPITPAQARIEAVADLTKMAMAKAGTLQLTPEESRALCSDFPDEAFQPGASGKENLIYIEHAALRDRLNTVLGLGQWAIIVRETWNEDFRTAKGVPGVRVYARAMLIVRGCYVGESVGDMDYYPTNASQNYGDAFEGAKTAAFRRCAKEFGVGLQAWRKDWCLDWWKRRQMPRRAPEPHQTPSQPSKAPETPSTAQRQAVTQPTEDGKTKLIGLLSKLGTQAKEYCEKAGMILPTEELTDLPLRFVPANANQGKEFMACVQAFIDGGEARKPGYCLTHETNKPKPDETKAALANIEKKVKEQSAEPWRSFPVPFGKNAGKMLGDLPKNVLFGFWANFKVETEYNGKPKKPETIAKDTTFRQMLDAAGAHYEFTNPDAPENPDNDDVAF